jgi:hypothetical protein
MNGGNDLGCEGARKRVELGAKSGSHRFPAILTPLARVAQKKLRELSPSGQTLDHATFGSPPGLMEAQVPTRLRSAA